MNDPLIKQFGTLKGVDDMLSGVSCPSFQLILRKCLIFSIGHEVG